MGFKDTGLIYFLLTLLAATATGTFTIFLLVTYTLARYVTLGGQNILGISELTYAILILFCEFNFNFAHRVWITVVAGRKRENILLYGKYLKITVFDYLENGQKKFVLKFIKMVTHAIFLFCCD